MSDPKVIPATGGREDVETGNSPSAAHSAFKEGVGEQYADEVVCNPPRRNHPGFPKKGKQRKGY